MKKLVFTLAFLVLLFSCGRKLPITPTRNNPAVFRITALETDNISEEITGNDEIHLMLWLVKDSLSNRILIKEMQDSMVFNTNMLFTVKNLSFQQSLASLVPEKTSLIVLLLEADTETPAETRTGLVRKIMQEANYQYDDSLELRISRNILDDDVLGLSFYTLSQLQQTPTGQIEISGRQLFDKYFYRLKYRWE